MKKIKLTPEEEQAQQEMLDAQSLASKLKELRNDYIPGCVTYSFEEGEEVVYGGHARTIILEKLDDGQIYRVKTINKKKESE